MCRQMLTKGVVDAHGPSHALLTLNRREDLSRVLESYRSFSQGIADGKEVHEPEELLASYDPNGANVELTGQPVRFWRPYRRSHYPG